MNKINSKCLSGDLNYLVTEYLQNSDLLPESELDTLVNKVKK